MRFYKGRWHYRGRSWPTLHGALLAVWPREEPAPEGKKYPPTVAQTPRAERVKKGLENAYFTSNYTTKAEAAQA